MKTIILFILFIIIFIISSKFFIENFIVNDTNTRLLFNSYDGINFNFNKNFQINSFPANDLQYENCNDLDLNNEKYSEYIYNILNINNNIDILLKISDYIKWTDWIDSDIKSTKIYNKFIKYLSNVLGAENINIVYDILKKIKYNNFNTNNILFNIDLLLYSKNNLYGKHLNMLVYYNNDKFYIIYLQIIGNVSEYNIKNNSYLKDINLDNHVDFISNNTTKDSTECDCHKCNIITDEYVNKNLEESIINNIKTNTVYCDLDKKNIDKNKKYNKLQNTVKNIFMNKLYTKTDIKPFNI
jgi:hypothetical protein